MRSKDETTRELIRKLRKYSDEMRKPEGSLLGMPDQELFLKDIFNKRLQQLEALEGERASQRADLLENLCSENPIQGVIDFLQSQAYVNSRIVGHELEIKTCDDILKTLEENNIDNPQLRRYLGEKRASAISGLIYSRNVHIFQPQLFRKFSKPELAVLAREWQNAMSQFYQPIENCREANERAKSAFVDAASKHLQETYGQVDLCLVLRRMDLLADEVIPIEKVEVEKTTKPYEKFYNLLPLIDTFKEMSIPSEIPFYSLDISASFIVPKDFSEQFEITANELLTVQTCLDHQRIIFDVNPFYMDKLWPDYQEIPPHIRSYFEQRGRQVAPLAEAHSRGDVAIYGLCFGVGAFEAEKPSLEKIASFIRKT